MRQLLSAQEVSDLREIMELHDEAFEHFMADPESVHKSSEGAVSVDFGNYWDRDAEKKAGVSVYSYALGPHRQHYFDTIAEGLEAVKEWHEKEMNRSYDADWDWDAE